MRNLISIVGTLLILLHGTSTFADSTGRSAEAAVRGIYRSASMKKLAQFKAFLTRDALSQFGNVTGMEELEKEIVGYQLKLVSEPLELGEIDPNTNTRFSTWKILVFGRKENTQTLVRTVEAECNTLFKWVAVCVRIDPFTGTCDFDLQLREEAESCKASRL